MNTLTAPRAVAAALLLAVAPLALAGEPYLEPGNVELSFGGSITEGTQEGGGFEEDFTAVSLGGRAGYFVSSLLEIGGAVAVNRIETDSDFGDDTFSYLQLGPFLDLNFDIPGSAVVPVVGAAAQFITGDLTGSVIDFSGGIRLFVSRDVSINVRAFLELAETEDDANFEVESTTLGTRVGFTWILR
jgi:hypothetical protein